MCARNARATHTDTRRHAHVILTRVWNYARLHILRSLLYIPISPSVLYPFTHCMYISNMYIQIHMQIKHKLTSLQTCSTMCIREISARVVVVCIYSSCYSTWRDRYTYTTSSYAIWSKGRQDREKTSDSPTW